jgi:hypothetical protein
VAAAGVAEGGGGVIDPAFLAQLRRRHRCQIVTTLVQLEQLCPNWWPTQRELADQLGIIRSELCSNMQELARLGLLGKIARSNTGGTWVYWVKRSEKDVLDESLIPAWVVRDQLRHTSERIHVDKIKEWALWREIPYNTLRSFLMGRQKVMDGRWTLVRTPFDELPDGAQP